MNTEKDSEIQEADKLRSRMAKIKPKVPKPYMSVYQFQFGKKTAKQKRRIAQVWNLRVADETITINFESLAKLAK